MADSKYYRLVLTDEMGKEIKTTVFRIYENDQSASEMNGQVRGFELARDALGHAGWWKRD